MVNFGIELIKKQAPWVDYLTCSQKKKTFNFPKHQPANGSLNEIFKSYTLVQKRNARSL